MSPEKRVLPLDEQAEFVMSFIQDSEDTRSDIEEIWDEVDDNYLVRPSNDMRLGTAFPLDATLGQTLSGRSRNTAILKDPETHQDVMTMLATIALQAFPVGGGFVTARSVGFEDIIGSRVVNGLLEHAFRLPGHFWSKVEQLLFGVLHGTGVGRWNWRYVEEARNVRSMSIDPLGAMSSVTQTLMMPVWNDPHFVSVKSRDFYPDCGAELLRDMVGAAEHFRITAAEAKRLAAQGIYDEPAVERAVEARASAVQSGKRRVNATDMEPSLESHPEFMQMDAYTYYGETPFRAGPEESTEYDGINRRVITVINGETVRSRPWPRALPYTEIKIMPRPGSFWGIGIGEVIRYDQDFADTIKMMLADAVVRMTHPPFIYNRNANVDLARLRRFNPRVPIAADGVDAVQTLNYQPQLNHAFAMYSGVKGQMRDGSGALDSLQGQTGPDREAATAASLRYQAAQNRPELFTQMLEREWLPQDGRLVLALYQEFLEDGEDEIRRRVGDSEIPASIIDISGDFDIEFCGSRQHSNRVQRIEAFREIAAAAANPIVAQLVPWIPLLRKWFKEQGAEDIAAMVGNPEMIQIHLALTQLGGGGRSPAQQPGSAAPPGLMPAQTAGVTS